MHQLTQIHIPPARRGGTDGVPPVTTRLAPAHPLLRLQSTAGNQAVQRLLQAKLEIGQPDDEYEREAERVAAQVSATAGSAGTGEPGGVRRCACGGVAGPDGECAACRAKRLGLSRLPASPVTLPGTTPTAPSIVEQVLRSGGQPLDPVTRARMEPYFGHDFSAVRVHTDAQAAASARAVNAHAYTVGQDVVFAAGRYDPSSTSGQRLLAHELVHVAQQDEVIMGENHSLVQRFGAEEHVQIGNTALSGQYVFLGTEIGGVSYGELLAIAGDFFESIEEIESLANDIYGRDQVLFALWKVNPSRPRPLVSGAAERAVMDRYNRLAAQNQTHFSAGSAPGQSNRERYIAEHTVAIRTAYTYGSTRVTWGPTWEAREAFSNHYLTDAFSAGHVRTPRGQIQSYWNGMYPNFQKNLVRMISCYMASYVNDRDAIGYLATVNQLADGIAPVIIEKAGSALSAFSIGDFISKVLHDADNAGLDVVSRRGPAGSAPRSPFRWRAVGDEYLYKPTNDPATAAAQILTQRMVKEAVRLSFEESQQAVVAGQRGIPTLTDLTNPVHFRALAYIPSEDTASTTNPIYDWKAPNIRSLPANLHTLLVAALGPGKEVRTGLEQIEVDCITTVTKLGINWDLHTGDAWRCFRALLLGDPFETIARVCEGTDLCPPGQNNPCPEMHNPCPSLAKGDDRNDWRRSAFQVIS